MGWDITDTTVFVMYLRRASDNVILAVLDSIGTFAKSNADTFDVRFGTSPQIAPQIRNLPSSSYGQNVYIEIMPEWYGTFTGCPCCQGYYGTSYKPGGLDMKLFMNNVNFSSTFSDSGNVNISDSLASAMSTQKYNELIAYTDSMYTLLDSCLPELPLGFDSTAQFARYAIHFNLISDTLSNGSPVWKNPHCFHNVAPLDKATGSASNSQSGLFAHSRRSNDISVQSISVLPRNREVYIRLNSSSNFDGILASVVDDKGVMIPSPWSGRLVKGNNVIAFKLPDIASGIYFLKFVSSDWKILGISRFSYIK
jgi:hypothetical protein